MPRRRAPLAQCPLFASNAERLELVLDKVRRTLPPEDMVLLEEAIQHASPVTKDNTAQLVVVWRREMAKRLGDRAPGVTGNEASVLQRIAKRETVAQTAELIAAFWSYCDQLPKDQYRPQPTPFGFEKHVADIRVWLSQRKRASELRQPDAPPARAQSVVGAVLKKAAEIIEEQKHAVPMPAGVKALIASGFKSAPIEGVR